MSTQSPSLATSAADELLHQQAEFHAFVMRDGSLARAADAFTDEGGDVAFALDALLTNDFVHVSSDTLEAAVQQAPEPEVLAVALHAQRVALGVRRQNVLAAIAERDAVYREEMAYARQQLAHEDIAHASSPEMQALKAGFERDLAHATICRQHLALVAQRTVEQRAMREAVGDRWTPTALAVQSEGYVETLLGMMAAAERRAQPIATWSATDATPIDAALTAELQQERAARMLRATLAAGADDRVTVTLDAVSVADPSVTESRARRVPARTSR